MDLTCSKCKLTKPASEFPKNIHLYSSVVDYDWQAFFHNDMTRAAQLK